MSDSGADDRRINRRQMIQRAGAAGAVAWTAPLLIESLASPAAAATPVGCTPGTRVQVFTGTNTGSGNSTITFTVPTTIPVGHSIVVAIFCSTAGNPDLTNHTASDTGPNIYTTHVVEEGTPGAVYICSAPVTTQLTGGVGTITATYPGFSGDSSGAVFDFCGTLTALEVNSDSGNQPADPLSSGFVAAAVGNLVLGCFGYGNNGVAYGGAAAGLANVEGQTTTGRRFQPMWQLISVANNYAASGTLPSGNFWSAAVVRFGVA